MRHTMARISDPTDEESFEVALEQLVQHAQDNGIKKAYDLGYFEVPRQITLAELSEELGISDQAINERMRRGLSTLVATTFKSDRTDGD